jgi:hypothetical protein
MKCNRQSMMAILHDKVHTARAVNAAEAIPLEDAPRGYAELDSGAAVKYVLNPDTSRYESTQTAKQLSPHIRQQLGPTS